MVGIELAMSAASLMGNYLQVHGVADSMQNQSFVEFAIGILLRFQQSCFLTFYYIAYVF